MKHYTIASDPDLNEKYKEDVVKEAQETYRRFMEWERKLDDQNSLEYEYPEYVVKNRAWTPVKMSESEVDEDMYKTVDMTKDVKKSKKQKRKEDKEMFKHCSKYRILLFSQFCQVQQM